MKHQIAVLKGDGIGPEVVSSAVSVLETASKATKLELDLIEAPIGIEAYRQKGRTFPKETIELIEKCPGAILGPLQTGSFPSDDKDHPMSSGKVRKRFDLFANIRPIKSYNKNSAIDFVIVRENTEDFFPNINLYKGYGEMWIDKDTVVSLRVVRRSSCARIARAAFDLASTRNKKLVSAIHKSNVLMEGDGLFLEECRKVSSYFPAVKFEEKLVDSTAMDLVLHPERYDVILTTNLFGDILSDEAAGLVGGLGISPSLNAGQDHAIAQAVHGTAPDIAGKGIANPVSEILSCNLLLEWLFKKTSDQRLVTTFKLIEDAVSSQLSSQDPKDKTLDMGGSASTVEFTKRLNGRLLDS